MSWLDLSRVRNELFRLRQNVPVGLCVPSRLIAQNAILWLETDEGTRERHLTRRHWSKSPPIWTSHFDFFYEFVPRRNGSFKFEVRTDKDELLLDGYLGAKPKDRDFDAARIVTLMPKFMPAKIDQWDAVIHNCQKMNYNVVHFTPLQKIGFSGSPYSIKDQLDFEPGFLCFDQ